MDQIMLLRVPEGMADRIREMIANESTDDMYVQFDKSGRHGTFAIGDEYKSMTLVDLPCITEANKIIGKSTLLKSGDVGQAIVVHDRGNPPTHHKYETPKGLTPASRQKWSRQKDIERYKKYLPTVDAKLAEIVKQYKDKDGNEPASSTSNTKKVKKTTPGIKVKVMDLSGAASPRSTSHASSPSPRHSDSEAKSPSVHSQSQTSPDRGDDVSEDEDMDFDDIENAVEAPKPENDEKLQAEEKVRALTTKSEQLNRQLQTLERPLNPSATVQARYEEQAARIRQQQEVVEGELYDAQEALDQMSDDE